MTKRDGRSLSNDPGFRSLLELSSDTICLVAKSSDYHARVALGISNEENLAIIRESAGAVVASGRQLILNCEHFFDGYKSHREYSLSVAKTAFEAGARCVVLCDTNGGTLPHEIERIVADAANVVPGTHLGIHAHNDTEHAVANSFAAVRAGCRQIHGTLSGIGEQCGNAGLTSIIPTLLLKPEFADRFEVGVWREKLENLTLTSRLLDEILDRPPDGHAPYVGKYAFATKTGIHASGFLKQPDTYEHIAPEAVGNGRQILVSNQAGRSNVLAVLGRMNIPAGKEDARVRELLAEAKRREAQGYAYDLAEASFELLVRRHISGLPAFFAVQSCSVTVKHQFDMAGQRSSLSQVSVHVLVDGDDKPVAATGTAIEPIGALRRALCNSLSRYQGAVDKLQLASCNVRIIQAASEPATRVLVETLDTSTNEKWVTIGVAPDFTGAALAALADSLEYKLSRGRVDVQREFPQLKSASQKPAR